MTNNPRRLTLIRFAGGKKWHLEHSTAGIACRTSKHPKRGVVLERVWVKSVWDAPVNGHTCINCHPWIELQGGELEKEQAE